mgnify:CR=1 FL=1
MEELKFTCPYCRSAVSVLLDTGIFGYAEIVDDCEVCCRPIEISYQVEDGIVTTFTYNSIDGNEF